MNTYSQKTIDEIIALHKAGKAPIDIGRQLGIPAKTVKTICDDYRIAEEMANINPTQAEYIVNSYHTLIKKAALITNLRVTDIEIVNNIVRIYGDGANGALDPVLTTQTISLSDLFNAKIGDKI